MFVLISYLKKKKMCWKLGRVGKFKRETEKRGPLKVVWKGSQR